MRIKDLPPHLAKLAELRAMEYFIHYNMEHDREEVQKRLENHEVGQLFSWSATKEGSAFWSDVDSNKDIEKHEERAKSIVGPLESNYSIF